jgi:hypothetical protein
MTEEQLSLQFELMIEGRKQTRTLDAKIDLADLTRAADRKRVASAITALFSAYDGRPLGFEVRCCYQIGDSKRIQADENAAEYLWQHRFAPILMIFCTTSLPSPVKRLRRSWTVTEGMASYDLLREISGFDLYRHLAQLRPVLAAEMLKVMKVFQLPSL